MFPFENCVPKIKTFEKTINYLDIEQRIKLRRTCKLWCILIDNLDKEIIDYPNYSFSNLLWPTGTFNFNNVFLDYSHIHPVNTSYLTKLRVFKSFYSFRPFVLKSFEKFKFLNYLEVGGIFLNDLRDSVEMIELPNLTTLFVSSVYESALNTLFFNVPKLKMVNFG